MPPAKILLFSADIPLANNIYTCLVNEGYKVIHLSSVIEAIEQIHKEKPELVILDKDLRDFSSMAIIRLIRANDEANKIPIVRVGSTFKEGDVLLGLEVGADFCLNENFHPQVFIARLRSLIRRSETVNSINPYE